MMEFKILYELLSSYENLNENIHVVLSNAQFFLDKKNNVK